MAEKIICVNCGKELIEKRPNVTITYITKEKHETHTKPTQFCPHCGHPCDLPANDITITGRNIFQIVS
jgi:DNA-directed RNA polymerase subunit RPC12/RpoP